VNNIVEDSDDKGSIGHEDLWNIDTIDDVDNVKPDVEDNK